MSKTVLLIHGFGFDSRTWLPVELAFEGYEVIRLSLPGFGGDTPSGAYTIASLAADFWEQVTNRSSSTVHLVGHSMGGYVCMEMLAQHPELVDSLSLVHSHVFEDTPEKKVQRQATLEDIKTNGRSGLVHKMIPSMFGDASSNSSTINNLIERGMHYSNDAWYYGTQAMKERADHESTLSQFSGQVLMIGGKLDKAVPVELIYKQASMPANCSLVLYEHVGHMGMYEHTIQMINDLISFFNRQA